MTHATTAPGDLLQVEQRGSFWFARLNRPDKRNALSDALVEALVALLERVSADLEGWLATQD